MPDPASKIQINPRPWRGATNQSEPVARRIAPPARVAALPAPALPTPALPTPALPGPVALPRVVSPDRPPDGTAMSPLPAVIEPSVPQRGGGKAGTGFFIANDGSLLTAAQW